MYIEKAIERLETFVERHPSAGYVDLLPAIKLGIEALKRIEATRLVRKIGPVVLLPGETDMYGTTTGRD